MVANRGRKSGQAHVHWLCPAASRRARSTEQDIYREGFRKLGLRICATDEELKKFDAPKRLPECVKT